MEFQRIHLDRIDSTNNYAANWLKMTKGRIPTAITTSYQSKGKGQRSKDWKSEKDKNILISYITYPTSPMAEEIFVLNKFIANAVHRVIATFLPDNLSVKIKWPNDIWVENKKLAGILIENQWRGAHISSSIVGIGINVNQTENLLPSATSMSITSNKPFSLEVILHSLTEAIQEVMEKQSEESLKAINLAYQTNLLGLNRKVNFNLGNNCFKGEIIDVNANGQLLILNEKQQLLPFNHGEIEVIYS